MAVYVLKLIVGLALDHDVIDYSRLAAILDSTSGAGLSSAIRRGIIRNMKTVIDLGGDWKLRGFDGYGEQLGSTALPQAFDNLLAIDGTVPGSVYRDLMQAGWIEDIYKECNSLKAQWVEQYYWYYSREFAVEERFLDKSGFLILDGLDLDAVIYLNGEVIAEHHNVYRPCRIDIRGKLKKEGNYLIVRVDSGLLSSADKRGGDYNLELTAVATKRAHLRKPQYGCRWDWSPRLMNVGIGKSVRLEFADVAYLDQVVIQPELSAGNEKATLRVRAHIVNTTADEHQLTLNSEVAGSIEHVEALATPGASVIEVAIEIDNPKLWWPRSQGEPYLYDVGVTLNEGDKQLDQWSGSTGIRKVELRQDSDSQGGSFFHILVNGQPIFCKGGNWVPADLLYPTVSAKDYQELISLATECEFNMLRVWGGGLYESHEFFDACDGAGIMVWHDMMFACSMYPADDARFRSEVEAEVRYNMRELSYHPSLVLWCGNNEVEVGVQDRWITSYHPESRSCKALFFETLAEIAKEEDSSSPYWASSPWSPDGKHPNARCSGDQHPWYVGLGDAKGDYWEYRHDASRFSNEGGMLGPSTMKTLKQILPESERYVGSRAWLHHDNTQNTWRGEPMVENMLRLNLCDSPRHLSFEDYVRYGAILHGEALETSIDNWRRRKFDSAAAVFWMFNDTWPACTSWTPIDYYRRRKPAFWYVKRAFSPLRVVCVELGDEVAVVVVNDLLEEQKLNLRYGLFALAGGRPMDCNSEITCPANSAMISARFPLGIWDEFGIADHAAFAVLSRNGMEVSTQRLFRERFRNLLWQGAPIRCVVEKGNLRLSCEKFAWSVSLGGDGEKPLADNHFDLLPGIEKTIPWSGGAAPALVESSNPSADIIA